MKDTITMTQAEQERAMVCTAVLSGEVGRAEAATWLGLSERQLRRVLAAYRAEGPAGVVHGNRGRSPAQTLSVERREQIVGLAAGRYASINDTHLSELLAQEEGITVSRSTVRRLRVDAGLARPRTRRAPRHRSRRQRMARAGMLVQIDGSHHRWLGAETPLVTLLAAIDDATGAVLGAVFREQEDAAGYLALLLGLVRGVGCPLALYHDRHGIFIRPARERESLAEQLRGQRDLTQVGRALQHLGIGSIRAHSPQAKGRVERLFGTLQDRLVVEMRLAGITTLEAANVFLPGFLTRFNARFAVPAAEAETAYQPLPAGCDPWQICCLAYERTVANDGTIGFGGQRLQLHPPAGRASLARATVEVREHLDGSLSVWHGITALTTTAAPPDAPQLRARGGARPTPVSSPGRDLLPDVILEDDIREQAAQAPPAPRGRRSPAPSHPWRTLRTANRTFSQNS
jgi:transposase